MMLLTGGVEFALTIFWQIDGQRKYLMSYGLFGQSNDDDVRT